MTVAPDLIITAEGIHTLAPDAEPQRVEALGITNGVVSHLGSRAEAQGWAGERTRVRDFPGGTVVPGLVDAHSHPVFGLGMTAGLSLTGVETLAEAERMLTAYGAEHPDAPWLQAWGLEQTLFGDEVPSNAFLARAVPGRKTFVLLFDGHAAVASAEALAHAGVTRPEKLPDGSEVVAGADGAPNGFLRELGAMGLLRAHLPVLSFEDKVEGLLAVLTDMAANGLTGIEMLDSEDPDSIALFQELERRGELPLRVRIAPWFLAKHGPEVLDEVIALQGIRGRRFEVRGAKLMIDGTVDNGTAWLNEPDTEGESTASLWLAPADYAAALARLHAAGVTTTTHAIGDRGVGFVAESIAALPEGGPAHRIEHIEALSDADLERLAASGAAASMQPTHCTHFVRPDRTDAWSRRLGAERSRTHTFRMRDVLDRGVLLALGSDWPIAPYDPREILADAQARRRTARPGSAVIDAQRLTAREALEGYTVSVHRSTGGTGGTLALGQLADVTVLSVDPLTATPEALLAAEVLGTLLGGETA